MKPDPIHLLETLLAGGHQVFYLDTDTKRLLLAERLGAHKVIDAKKWGGRSMIHPEILLAVHTEDWHPLIYRE
jgi:hypothetical protein